MFSLGSKIKFAAAEHVGGDAKWRVKFVSPAQRSSPGAQTPWGIPESFIIRKFAISPQKEHEEAPILWVSITIVDAVGLAGQIPLLTRAWFEYSP